MSKLMEILELESISPGPGFPCNFFKHLPDIIAFPLYSQSEDHEKFFKKSICKSQELHIFIRECQ